MPILVDTSVWRRFFVGSRTVASLQDLLEEPSTVVLHPVVFGELLLGGISRQQEDLFARLPATPIVPHDEVFAFVKRRQLARRGIGWADANLLASALAAGARIWTADRALAKVASNLSVVYSPGEA